MLLLADAKLEERRKAVGRGGPLAPLFDSLAAELEPLIGREPYVPDEKALLSRAGGRCERDGTTLEFDPYSPDRHRCPACGVTYSGELHHRAWVWPYQLWLAERSVHGALFALLRGDPRHASIARDILRAYADRYETYPNQDNVLGPTRLFFSTYLESIWLLNIVIAADLLRAGGDAKTANLVGERIVEPSSMIIGGYDEGMSNRQVWNNAALLASAFFLGRDATCDRLLDGPSGLRAHLSEALLSDGTWYEGENYHQFALRGLWYGMVLAEVRGRVLDAKLVDRFHRAFAAPYVTALPDFTMPSRKDSQYAVSLRQWRVVETAELGFARTQDPLLGSALARSYESSHERHDTGRSRSTADVEKNGPSGVLTRADLGWRALLHAMPVLPELRADAPGSALLEGQGYAVFRRPGDVYVGFEFGQSGGGHGHPDRLNLTLYQGKTRWLDDLGTGSYVDPSLHWYRSTLAHNAPLVNGRSQPLRDGRLIAYDEQGEFGWVVGEFHVPEEDVRLERAIVVGPYYLVDELRWTAGTDVRVELPLHVQSFERPGGPAATMDGGPALEDGFAFVRRAHTEDSPFMLAAKRDGQALIVGCESTRELVRMSAEGPGQPPSTVRRFLLMRATGKQGVFRTRMSWIGGLSGASKFSNGEIQELGIGSGHGREHWHRRDATGWHIETTDGRRITLAGFRPPVAATRETSPHPRSPIFLRRGRFPDRRIAHLAKAELPHLHIFELGEAHYRRSEEDWTGAGSPRATVAIGVEAETLVLHAEVRAGDAHFASADATNPFDNEHPDTMAAGIQLHFRTVAGVAGWMMVPEPSTDRVRSRSTTSRNTLPEPTARWRRTADGYEMRIEMPLPGEAFDFDLIVNETRATRRRRRGQLVLSGANGEFVYLRGDRHDPERFLKVVVER